MIHGLIKTKKKRGENKISVATLQRNEAIAVTSKQPVTVQEEIKNR